MQGLQIVIKQRPSNDDTLDESTKDTKRQSFFNCLICNEERDETFELLPCNHMVHKSCCEQYINREIHEVKLPQIKCPRVTCKRFLKDQQIQQALKPEFLQRYQELVIRRINEKESKVKLCPKVGCTKMFQHDNENPSTTCGCGSKICNTCYNFAHDGRGCVEAMKGKFPKYAKQRNLKYCYRCRTIVIDSEGSTLIKCAGCSKDWCFDCGNPFGESHEYSCYGKWNPPILKEEEDKPPTFIGRTLRFFLSLIGFVALLPLKTVFWPFFLLNVGHEMKANETTDLGKAVLLFVAIALTVIYNGLVGTLYYFMGQYPEYSLVFNICIVAATVCPWILLLVANATTNQETPEEPSLEMKIRNLRYDQPQSQPQPAQSQREGHVKIDLPDNGEASLSRSTMAQSPTTLNRTQSAIGLLEKQTTIDLKCADTDEAGGKTPGYAILIEEGGTDIEE